MEVILKQGYLIKKCKRDKWKRKWCSATFGFLSISSKETTKAQNRIKLTKCLLQEAPYHVTEKPNVFALVSGRAYFFQASSSAELTSWLFSLNYFSTDPIAIKEIDSRLEPTVIISKTNIVLTSNLAFEKALGYSKNDFYGKSILGLFVKQSDVLKHESELKNFLMTESDQWNYNSGIPKVFRHKLGDKIKATVMIIGMAGESVVMTLKIVPSIAKKSRQPIDELDLIKKKLEKAKQDNASLKTENDMLHKGKPNIYIDDIFFKGDPADLFIPYEIIGSGTFATVIRAIHKRTDHEVAIKVLSQKVEYDSLVSEIKILRDAKNQYVIRYYGAYCLTKKSNNMHWIVMEYCNVGSLRDLMIRIQSPLSEKHIKLVLYQVVRGIKCVHSIGRIHRDIKAANVLALSSGECKLSDFSISAEVETMVERFTSIGTPYWMAPEIIDEDGHNKEVDIWSLGITAIELAEGDPPHKNKSPFSALFAISTNPPPTLSNPCLWSQDFRDFVFDCLKKNPDERPSANDLLDHHFLADICEDTVSEQLEPFFSKNTINLSTLKPFQISECQDSHPSPISKSKLRPLSISCDQEGPKRKSEHKHKSELSSSSSKIINPQNYSPRNSTRMSFIPWVETLNSKFIKPFGILNQSDSRKTKPKKSNINQVLRTAPSGASSSTEHLYRGEIEDILVVSKKREKKDYIFESGV